MDGREADGRTQATLPVQYGQAPAGTPAARARYFNAGNAAFNVTPPPVPDIALTAEAARALDPASGTGLFACDAGERMGLPYPATTPLLLARYARIRGGDTLAIDFACSGSIWYVIAGRGVTEAAGERIEWGPGDAFVLPGGGPVRHSAGDGDAVLWSCTDEPQTAFFAVSPPAAGRAAIRPVHFPADELARQLDLIYSVAQGEQASGMAVMCSVEGLEGAATALPGLSLALNSLPPGAGQRPHRHNSVAVMLILRGSNAHSLVDGHRKDWSDWATTVTPPGAVHSHHNEGSERALFLIVQDLGLHHHARTTGFEFA